jgi:hypothetical protein
MGVSLCGAKEELHAGGPNDIWQGLIGMSNDHFNYTTTGYPGTGKKDFPGPCPWINQGESEGLIWTVVLIVRKKVKRD